MNRAILVFLKFPESGRVKTRLAAGIGEDATLVAYRQMVAKVFEQCRNSGADILAIAYDPPEREAEVESWLSPYLAAFPGEILFLPQVTGDLGQRLEAGVEEVFRRFSGVALSVIGTDCVDLDAGLFEETWAQLEQGSDIVYGPTEDGGYYLVALNTPRSSLFREIPWSSESTLEASLSVADTEGLKTHLIPNRIDVDTEEEWRRVETQVKNRRCVFFDRDGVVNRSPGPGYVLRKEDFHLNPGVSEAISSLKERGWLAILVTSQRGVGKGLMTLGDLDEIHQKMQRELGAAGESFDGIYAYTGLDDCLYPPKPDPGMILAAAERFFIDLRQSWMIGDADRDIEMGKAAGLAGTVRIRGEKPIGFEADFTLEDTEEILRILEKFE
ncbi:MAG: TIGR04282 family arsenosugar biosynthesis glycosyltransferase [Verrucomicrobiota bacterium]